ncbi:hypothetical protein FRB90_008196 [Tulasnella sp. 427]|nr:hypothetical protein FRB90_008196 [Tulasnella sp. 427]
MGLDRIHDHDTPYEALNTHPVERARLRCVSRLWNSFIIDSPNFWSSINIYAPHAELIEFLERAGDSALCVYHQWACGSGKPPTRNQIESVLVPRQGQIRTLRFLNPGLCNLGLSLVAGSKILRTLELVRPSPASGLLINDCRFENPLLRHMSLEFWRLPQDMVLALNLESLVLRDLDYLDLSLFRALSSCSESLRRFHIRFNGHSFVEPDAISFPRLEELRIQALYGGTAKIIMNAVIGPPSMSGIIKTIVGPSDLDLVDDLSSFLLPTGGNALDATTTTVELELDQIPTWFEYTRGKRSLQLGFNCGYEGAAAQMYFKLIQAKLRALNPLYQDPVTSLIVLGYVRWRMNLLDITSCCNVHKLVIRLSPFDGLAEQVETTIGEHATNDGDSFEWRFAGLRHLILTWSTSCFDPTHLVPYIERRQLELQAMGYPGLEELTFAHCDFFDGIEDSDFVDKLGRIGIAVTEIKDDDGCRCDFHSFRSLDRNII